MWYIARSIAITIAMRVRHGVIFVGSRDSIGITETLRAKVEGKKPGGIWLQHQMANVESAELW